MYATVVTKNYAAPSEGVPGLKPFQFRRPELASQEYGRSEKSRYTKRVPVATIKKWGGPIVHALTVGEGSEGSGRNGRKDEREEEGSSLSSFVASRPELAAARGRAARAVAAIDEAIAGNRRDNKDLRKRATEAASRRREEDLAGRPRAEKSGAIEGDTSLSDLKRTLAKPLTKSAVTSDPMKRIMKCIPNYPGENPDRSRPVPRNAMRTVEATEAEWQRELGKH